jgi:hypothetical protein
VQSAYTHFELESLPSGGWGYLDFPLKQRYVRTLGIEAMGMTGKFHTSWGDFHSLKNPAALEFETSLMLALNAKCSIGDQLHPSGRIDRATYELIGEAYAKVEKKEPWCVDARPVSDVGVLTPEEFIGGAARTLPAASWGAVRMLTELRAQFDVLDSKSDFAATASWSCRTGFPWMKPSPPNSKPLSKRAARCWRALNRASIRRASVSCCPRSASISAAKPLQPGFSGAARFIRRGPAAAPNSSCTSRANS